MYWKLAEFQNFLSMTGTSCVWMHVSKLRVWTDVPLHLAEAQGLA